MNDGYIDAIIKVEVPKWQIGEEVSVYFPDTMYVKGKCVEDKTGEWYENEDGTCTCSNCYRISEADWDFCHHCGSRMKGDVE